jgi:hypothetical protein
MLILQGGGRRVPAELLNNHEQKLGHKSSG